ncbi:peptidoglycan-binding domain-containing protein [Streptomyces filamentosus]|uniref:peptidoglycan-binding domain-containing protein n=1 Tax=Streptomyces filamentosus TaxID=67294 RepID=UPI00357128A5
MKADGTVGRRLGQADRPHPAHRQPAPRGQGRPGPARLHPDGIYGTKTYNAVRAFQTRAGLKNDGSPPPRPGPP